MATLNRNIYKAHCYATHVLSEIAKRWISLPSAQEMIDCDDSRFPTDDCKTWDRITWQEFLREALYDFVYRPQWVPMLESQRRLDHTHLAEALLYQFTETRRHKARYLCYGDKEYPKALRYLSDPPAAVSVQGPLELFAKPMVAIVGARKATPYSYSQAHVLGSLAAEFGCTIVSGGAIGCDIAAHKGVMANGVQPFPAVVVMPSGIARKVPLNNQLEFFELIHGGALFMSERLCYADARPHDFRARNRIIAGLSQVIVLVHAEERSGAMMTVSKGLAEGREIMVLRAPEQDIRYAGNHRLLAEGAPGFLGQDEFLCMLRDNLILRQ